MAAELHMPFRVSESYDDTFAVLYICFYVLVLVIYC